ncbi:Fic family protein [Joostella atrarenae]|uniref:Fic family protein n=1 Tax=Joostella atrarenae TaxID=679257 RepID=A0ABS9J4V8_9FLAO|nr:Fic family protein [Joostella atrarenae]MCF8715464.1 Fic family protein [Joostella atrarenae]
MDDYKAGSYIIHRRYVNFQPTFINKEWLINNREVLSLLSKADRQVGRLDMFSEYVNMDMFVNMHIFKEVVQSSNIDGAYLTLEEAFMKKEDLAEDKKGAWQAVRDCVSATNKSINSLKNQSLQASLIKEAHKTLSGKNKAKEFMPGEYRRTQNWIGGSSVIHASFVPPTHKSIDYLMEDLLAFGNDKSNALPDLLKVALIHYQFETIHPFVDGNGKIGRLLIVLNLMDEKLIRLPILYFSDYLQRNKDEYFRSLNKVRKDNDLQQWLKFFLKGIAEVAKDGAGNLNKILQMQRLVNRAVNKLDESSDEVKKVVAFLYLNPVIDVNDVVELINVSEERANTIIKTLVELGILCHIDRVSRVEVYSFKKYIDLFGVQGSGNK